MVWVFETEPLNDGPLQFYLISEPTDSGDWYIQNEPTEHFDTLDHFYIQYEPSDSDLSEQWYIQNEPTESAFDEFYIQGEPNDADEFYIITGRFDAPGAFYLLDNIDLFGPNDSQFFYFVIEQEIPDDGGWIMASDYQGDRHDWRSELTNSGTGFIEVSLPIEELMVDLTDLMLSPEEIQTDQDEWVIIRDED